MKKLITFSIVLVFMSTTLLNSQWINQNSGTTKSLFCSCFLDANTGVISGDSSIFLKTTNGGTNWITATTPGNWYNYYAGVYMQNSNVIYLAQGYSNVTGGNGAILYSSNGGNNWTSQLTTLYDIFSVAFTGTSTGFAVGNGSSGSQDSLYKTTNGSTWSPVSVSSIGFMTYVYFYNSSTGFICSMTSDNILRTTNGGLNWSVIPTGAGQGRVNHIVMADINMAYGVSDNGIFLKSTNGGLNWISQSFGTLHGISVGFFSASIGFIVSGKESTQQYEILKTTNAGSNWMSVMSGTGKMYWYVTFANALTGWIVGERGSILKTTNGGGVWVSKIATDIPGKYLLQQNYPNPFNPSTVINYHLPKNTRVKLSVFDVNGKEIAVIVNDKQTAGIYEAIFDASDLSSGIYFYKLITDDYSKTVKMVLVK